MSKSEVKKPESTAVADWQAELNALTVQTAEAEKPTGNWVSFKGGILSVGGTPMKGNKVEAVVIHSVFENQWYKERYDPNNPTAPHCFALAESDDDLKPHPDAAEPQAPSCAECAKNQWGSDPGGGKGKACKNVRRLAMIAATDLENVAGAEVAVAKLPVTSVKNWATYASQIANVLKLPPLAVKTEMSVEPDAKTQFQVNFSLVDKVPEEHLPALLSKRRDTTPLIFAGYEKPTEAQAKKY
jgi:hypothetical protein